MSAVGRIYITAGGFVYAQRLVIAEIGIDRAELLCIDAVDRLAALALIAQSPGCIEVVIARQDQDLHAGLLDPFQLARQLLMAQPLAVKAQISAEDQQLRALVDHLFDESLRDRFDVQHQFAVTVVHDLLKQRAVIRQRRGQIVQIGGDGNRQLPALPAVCLPRDGAARQQQHRCQQQRDDFLHLSSPLGV